MEKEVLVNHIYRHFKRKYVMIKEIATYTEDDPNIKSLVVYEEMPYGKVWARPIEMFTSEVDRDKYPKVYLDMGQKDRFQLIPKGTGFNPSAINTIKDMIEYMMEEFVEMYSPVITYDVQKSRNILGDMLMRIYDYTKPDNNDHNVDIMDNNTFMQICGVNYRIITILSFGGTMIMHVICDGSSLDCVMNSFIRNFISFIHKSPISDMSDDDVEIFNAGAEMIYGLYDLKYESFDKNGLCNYLMKYSLGSNNAIGDISCSDIISAYKNIDNSLINENYVKHFSDAFNYILHTGLSNISEADIINTYLTGLSLIDKDALLVLIEILRAYDISVPVTLTDDINQIISYLKILINYYHLNYAIMRYDDDPRSPNPVQIISVNRI